MRVKAPRTRTRKFLVEAGRQVRQMVTRKRHRLTLRLCSLTAITFLASNSWAFKSEKARVVLEPILKPLERLDRV